MLQYLEKCEPEEDNSPLIKTREGGSTEEMGEVLASIEEECMQEAGKFALVDAPPTEKFTVQKLPGVEVKKHLRITVGDFSFHEEQISTNTNFPQI